MTDTLADRFRETMRRTASGVASHWYLPVAIFRRLTAA